MILALVFIDLRRDNFTVTILVYLNLRLYIVYASLLQSKISLYSLFFFQISEIII